MFISTVEINDVTGKVSPAEQSTCLQPSEEQMIDEMSTVHFQTPVGKTTDRKTDRPLKLLRLIVYVLLST